MKPHKHVPLVFKRMSPAEQLRASREFVERMAARRSVRFMSSEPVPFELIENGIRCAALAPSGANQQPWTFVVVKDPEIKRKIREAAEAEERESYEHRMPQAWLDALAPLGTDWHKEFLEAAPYLIVVFRIDFGLNHAAECETKTKHYYVQESVGIATEPDGFPFEHPRPSEKRTTIRFDSGRFPSRGRDGSRHRQKDDCPGDEGPISP
jgi:iodotyrosine deiodinase